MEKSLLCLIICFAPIVGDNLGEGEDVSRRGTHPLDPSPSPITLAPWTARGMDRDEQRVSVKDFLSPAGQRLHPGPPNGPQGADSCKGGHSSFLHLRSDP